MEHPENNEAYKGLTVNKGIDQPATINPYLKARKRPKRRQFTAGEYVEGILKGDITVLSQAVTLIESVKHEHQALAQEVIEKCLPFSGRTDRYQWCARCWQEYFDRCFRIACPGEGRQACRTCHRPQQRAFERKYFG